MTNCLTYALCMWIKHGGYIMMRKSLFIEEFPGASKWHPAHLVPHFLHRDKNYNVTQYTISPEERELSKHHSGLRKWLKLWHFDGVIIGDDKW
jgi:hypothetical protein